MMRRWLTLLLLGVSPWLSAATQQRETPPLGWQSLLETGGGLLLILLLIFGGAWLYRRYAQLPTFGKGLIRVLGGVSVGPRERVIILEVENTRVLVGVAPGQVRTLHVFEPGRSATGFAARLNKIEGEGPRGACS